jgi:hypothetical protein
MPPLKPGFVVSQTGKIVKAKPLPTPSSANVRESGTRNNKPVPIRSDSVQAAQKQSAAIKQSQAAQEKIFRDSLPFLTSNFKGVGIAPYLDKDGNVQDLGKVIKINKSGGPSGDGTIVSDDFDNSNPVMDPIPKGTSNTTPVVVRTPTRNVTDISSLVPQFDAEQIQKLLFENISAIELSKVERHDTIEGIDQRYSIISNLTEIRKKYDMAKQLTIMDKFKPLTSIFTINIEDKIPQEDYLALENLNSTYQYLDENNEIVDRQKGYYYIDTNGDLVIELINLEKNQQVEVLIDTNGTIYKIEKVES